MVYLPQVFQFTPLREGRPAGIFDATRRPYFNSRPSARGDDGLHTLFERLPDFNSRPSARGDIAALVAFRHVEDFNSRPSARGDREFVHGAARVGISIHAPPRGATSQKNAKKGFTRFQFTPLREGRRGKSCTTSSFLRFQFTLLREGRLPTVCHASPPKAFQFTPLREGRLDDVMNALKPILFQFTPLREGRHVSDEGVRVHFYFNSRPSARGDSCTSISSVLFTISIHAPPRGATGLR